MWGGLIPSSRQTENCSIHEWPEQDLTSSLSINTHMHTIRHTHQHSDWFTQIHASRKTSVRPASYEFSFLFHFHPPVSSFSHLSCSLLPLPFSLLFLFLPYCFSHHLSIATFFLSLIQAPCLSFSLSLSHQPPFRSLGLRLQASCVYISVVYFYKCQTVFLPSVYWSRDRESDGEMEARSGKRKREVCW